MKNTGKKGFTIVELVIVIAVIAVLAAVLIPTFSSVVDRANESAALQNVQNAYIEALAKALGTDLTDKEVTVGDFKFTFSDPTGQNAAITGPSDFKYTNAKIENGVVVLGTASDGNEEGGGTGGANGGSGGPVTNAADLIDALEAGGDVTLGDDIEVTDSISIGTGKTATIDLAGYTLTLKDNAIPPDDADEFVSNVITVANGGVLTISDTGEGDGIVIAEPDYDYYFFYDYSGICVQEGGKLNFTGVKIEANSASNIENYGTISLAEGTEVTVNGGTGLSNEGTGTATISSAAFTVNGGYGVYNGGGTATITNGEFVASGTDVTLLYIEGGTATVDGTTFKNNEDCSGTITVDNGELTLTGVTLETGVILGVGSAATATIKSGEYNGAVSNSAGILGIEGGTFNGKISCLSMSTVTISGGVFNSTFYCKGDGAAVNISGGTFNDKFEFGDTKPIITISGGTFYNGVTYANLATVEVTDIIYYKSGIVMNNTYNSFGYWTIGHTNIISS